METKMWKTYWCGNLMEDRQETVNSVPTVKAKTASQIAEEKWNDYKNGLANLSIRRDGQQCEYLYRSRSNAKR